MENISYSLAVLGGVLSFVSPCVLPLVPPYMSYLAGVSIEEMHEGVQEGKVTRRIVLTAVIFVLGFSTVFVASGVAASALGKMINHYRDWFNIFAGLVIIFMGLHFLGFLRFSLLYREARFTISKPLGLGGAYVMGLAFAFGWTPCIGPILASILMMAGNEASVLHGASLLAVYSAGLGIPFILTAFLIKPFTVFFTHFRKHLGIVEKVMGVLLIITGFMFLFSWNASFSIWLLDTFPGLLSFEGNILNWFQVSQ